MLGWANTDHGVSTCQNIHIYTCKIFGSRVTILICVCSYVNVFAIKNKKYKKNRLITQASFMEIRFAVRTVYIYIYMFFIYNLHLITRTIAIHIYHSKCAYKSIMLQISKISGISILSNFPRFQSKHFNHCKQTFRTFQTNQT